MSKVNRKLKLDKLRTFKYNYAALEYLEDNSFDVMTMSLALSSGKDFDITTSRIKLLVHAGLLHEDSELQLSDMNKLMDTAPLNKIFKHAMAVLVTDLNGE